MRSKTRQDASLYDQIINTVIGELRQQGISSIRANCDGFASPGKVRWDEEDEGIIPDIVVEHKGATHVFEIEFGEELKADAVEDRWRLLSTFARRCKGKFYLVIPERRERHLRGVIKDVSVRPEILKLQGIA